MEHIKVNLPATEADYIRGNGEGVFVLVGKEAKAAYDKDDTSGIYNGILDNDSFYYKGLEHGAIIPFEMRGEYRPIVPFSWLIEHYEINKKFFEGTPEENYI